MFRPVGQLRFQLPWSGANSASRSRKHFLRSNIWTNSTLLFHFFFSRCVWPSRERPRTCRASSLSATGARLTGPAPQMVTRNPGAQPSESIIWSDNLLILLTQSFYLRSIIYHNIWSFYYHRVDRYGNHQLGNWGDCNLASCMQRNDGN